MSRNPWAGERIGNLRERITLVEPGEPTIDPGSGQEIPGVPVLHEVYARVQPLKGQEVLAAAEIAATHEISFIVRYRADVTPLWEIEWQGKTYNVQSSRNADERRRFLTIEATARAE